MHRCPKQTFDIQYHVTKKVKPCGKGSNKFKFDIKLKLKKLYLHIPKCRRHLYTQIEKLSVLIEIFNSTN